MSTSHIKTLKTKHIKYFNFKFDDENKDLEALVINLSHHVFYRDVFIFINRLKDLTAHRIALIVIKLI